ncbi:hypothetical protein [Actinomadura xylanilytica]|uniref:hypothetical protein n=1 Tax=Actinomadura xylanilytica TaxID=887459 RepID=UPI00255A8ACA|nr:hypothetical protein [Actinomadura xylanilytica]MDL4777186.1 hypothetical protein [Actinomadura xylanilytica]
MRRGWFVLILSGLLLGCPPVAARAAPGPSSGATPGGASGSGSTAGSKPGAGAAPAARAEHLAALLRRDPVYVTDHAPRALAEDAAARIKASVRRLGVPVFVVVTPTLFTTEQDAGDLLPLLRDHLNRDGVYVVVDPKGGDGAARQYGGGRSLPVEDAWSATMNEMAYDAGAVAVVGRLVDITLSGHARERRERMGPRPKSKVRIRLDEHDRSERRAARKEHGALAAGAAITGVPLLGSLLWGRRRRHLRAERARLADRARAARLAERKAVARPGPAARRKNRKKRR